MVNWRFTLNPDTDALVIDEPIGWADVAISIVRDAKMHGISIAYSETDLKITGVGADYIRGQYALSGTDAKVTMLVELLCDDDNEEVSSVDEFRLDFKQYTESCGDDCHVEIGFSQKSCFQTFRNNYEKTVDLDSTVGLDGTTPVPLPDMKRLMVVPAKAILVIDSAAPTHQFVERVDLQPDWFDNISGNEMIAWLAPPLDGVTFSGFGDFLTSSYPALFNGGFTNMPPIDFPVTVNTTVISGDIKCGLADGRIQFRCKGKLVQNANVGKGATIALRVMKLKKDGDPTNPADFTTLYQVSLAASGGQGTGSDVTYPFDREVDLTNISIVQGDKFYYGITVRSQSPVANIHKFEMTFDEECYFKMSAVSLCEDSNSYMYLVYESIHHLAKLISNDCLKVYSEYYGRTDSVDKYASDGCGSLRGLTSGLFLRNAKDAKMFLSMKDTLDGLQAIDNIGFCLEDTDDGERLRVEPAQAFYTDDEIFECNSINSATMRVLPQELYGIIKFGYDKWQPENILGLDEFNSTREYHSTMESSDITLDITCKFAAAGYLIELARQQSFADTNAADTKYDNYTFILCLSRHLSYYSSYVQQYGSAIGGNLYVEQGDIIDADNMISPETVLNFRIRPFANLIRWWKSLVGQFPDLNVGKLKFGSGTGNLLAKGWYGDACAVESGVTQENQDLKFADIKYSADYLPLLKPESVTFEYPMSVGQYKRLRTNPYGFIRYQCGNGKWKKGYISKLTYRPTKGKASFELRNKY